MMRYVVVFLYILSSLIPVAAQDKTETVPLSGGLDITTPENWTVASQNGTGYFWETGDSHIRIRTEKLFEK